MLYQIFLANVSETTNYSNNATQIYQGSSCALYKAPRNPRGLCLTKKFLSKSTHDDE